MPLTTASATQFTSEAFLGVLELHPIAIGMDGKGRWRDKAFAKHHWRSVKYEEVYLKAYESMMSTIMTDVIRHSTDKPHGRLMLGCLSDKPPDQPGGQST